MVCVSSRRRRSSSRAMRTRRGLLGAGQASQRSAVAPLGIENNELPGSTQLGPQIVQMPLQRVVERYARRNEALAVIDE